MVACLVPTAPGKSTVDTAFCKWSTPCLTSKFSSQALKRTRKRFPRASCCNDTQAAFAKNSRCVACCASARQERIIWHFLLLPTSGTLRTSLPGSVCVSTDIHSWVVGVNPPSSRNSALLAGSRIWAAVRWAGLFWCFLKTVQHQVVVPNLVLGKVMPVVTELHHLWPSGQRFRANFAAHAPLLAFNIVLGVQPGALLQPPLSVPDKLAPGTCSESASGLVSCIVESPKCSENRWVWDLLLSAGSSRHGLTHSIHWAIWYDGDTKENMVHC